MESVTRLVQVNWANSRLFDLRNLVTVLQETVFASCLLGRSHERTKLYPVTNTIKVVLSFVSF